MTDRPGTDAEGLAMRVNALRTAQDTLHQNTAEAISTIRRISRSITFSEDSLHYPEIVSLASTLNETRDEHMAPTLAKILPRLDALASNPPSRPYRVLLVDDDPMTIQVLQPRLDALHQQVITAGTLAEAEKLLAQGDIALILLDLHLPDGDGRDFLVKMRERPMSSITPIFVISSKEGSEVQTECFALGADAFFHKPFNPVTIATAVSARLHRSADMANYSFTDSLTALPNRAAFSNAFRRAALLASRSSEPLSVAMLDVDRFKAVNDMYGHPMGDHVLRRLATVVGKSLRASDLLARWGGEEFAIFFPNTDLPEACLALNKALKAFRRESFKTAGGRPFRVTFSAGVVRAKPGMSVERAMGNADRCLYRAKASGRDHISTEMDRVSLKKNILLVEDDDLTAKVIKRHLLQEGYKVVRAKSADEALAASLASISLITLDVKIPGVDGFELLRRFRQMPALQHVPIVMLTSVSKQEDVIHGFRLGADDYIVKPFSPHEFLARIHRFLDRH